MERVWLRVKKHPLLFLMGYFAVYNIVFWFLEAWARPVHFVHCRLDDLLPFWSAAVIPYIAWFVWVPAMLLWFYLHSADSYWRLLGALINGITIALVSYVVYPTGLNLRRPVANTGLCSKIVSFIYRTDTATNVCPSLHVYVTVLLLLAVLTEPWAVSALLRWGSMLLSLAICASTVLIDQHSLIDVFFGAALALFVYLLHYRTALALHRTPIRQPAPAGSTAR